jgi:hypothetical protein
MAKGLLRTSLSGLSANSCDWRCSDGLVVGHAIGALFVRGNGQRALLVGEDRRDEQATGGLDRGTKHTAKLRRPGFVQRHDSRLRAVMRRDVSDAHAAPEFRQRGTVGIDPEPVQVGSLCGYGRRVVLGEDTMPS